MLDVKWKYIRYLDFIHEINVYKYIFIIIMRFWLKLILWKMFSHHIMILRCKFLLPVVSFGLLWQNIRQSKETYCNKPATACITFRPICTIERVSPAPRLDHKRAEQQLSHSSRLLPLHTSDRPSHHTSGSGVGVIRTPTWGVGCGVGTHNQTHIINRASRLY